MEQLIHSCSNHKLYPRNLLKQRLSPQRADAYLESLQSEESRLFDKESRVNVLDGNDEDEGIISDADKQCR